MQNAFIRNRTEEFGHDIWSSYVLPPYFPGLGLNQARKSVVLEGGRGCGKTALLRYLSYQSQFSPERSEVPDEALKTIGLYLKADSQYFSGFTGAGFTDTQWQNVFEHALCLALAEQIVGSIQSLNASAKRAGQWGGTDKLDFNDAAGGFVTGGLPPGIDAFEKWLRTQRQNLSRWFKSFDVAAPPELLPLREFLAELIGEARKKLPYLANSVFAVYIDEYENLLEYQQKLLNTLIKSGEPPLIFHVAMKPNGMRTRKTTGPETIQEVADFRLIKLDDALAPQFKLFAAELFFFRLIGEAGVHESETPVSLEVLRDEHQIGTRLTDTAYQARVLAEMGRILPGKTYAEIAREALADPVLLGRWKRLVTMALVQSKSSLTAEDFLFESDPDASAVCAALLHQRSKTPHLVLEELRKHVAGTSSKFRDADWIHHFLVGTLLLLYLPYRQRSCPVYAGFDAFAKLSRTSVRHFLELCHLSIGTYSQSRRLGDFNVAVDVQAKAAFSASQKFRKEVTGNGDQGNRLLAVVNFLGKLFRLSQARPSQSEAERTHFSILDDGVTGDSRSLLDEAVKWSVLLEEPETKVKGNRYESNDYVLNPIYAPFFGISFNKGRKLEIQSRDADVILSGPIEQFTQLLRQYEKKWAIVSNEDQFEFDLDSGDE